MSNQLNLDENDDFYCEAILLKLPRKDNYISFDSCEHACVALSLSRFSLYLLLTGQVENTKDIEEFTTVRAYFKEKAREGADNEQQ